MTNHAQDDSLSIIIVNYNGEAHIERCLQSIEPGADVWVVDNASQDKSVEIIRSKFPAVQLIEAESNLGFSKAINLAVKKTSGEAILLLNPDTEMRPHTYKMVIERCGQLHRKAFGFRQVDAQNHFQLSFGFRPNLMNEFLRRSVQRRLDRKNILLGAIIDRVFSRKTAVSWVAGSSLLVSRDAFEKIDGFDENFFLFFEDIDFCLRLAQSGIEIVYDPAITLLHHRGQSSQTNLENSKQAYRQSQRYFWKQHHGVWAESMIGFYQRMRGFYH